MRLAEKRLATEFQQPPAMKSAGKKYAHHKHHR